MTNKTIILSSPPSLFSIPLLLISLLFAFLLSSCKTYSNPSLNPGLEKAKTMIQEGKAQCIVMHKDGKILAVVAEGRGLSPILKLYEQQGNLMQGAWVVDKVVGRAAAFVAINGGAIHVHGELMSQDAQELLTRHHITSSYTKIVPRILNRQMNGLCPLEQSVLGIEEQSEALKALKKRIEELQKK